MNRIFAGSLSPTHVKKVLGFTTGSLGAVFFSYMAAFFLNKELSKEDMGAYSYAFNLLNLIFPVISLSTSSGYTRFIRLYNMDLLIGFVRKISWLSTFLFCILIIYSFHNWHYVFFSFIILYQERLILARAKLEIMKFNFLNISQKMFFLFLLFYSKEHLSAERAFFFLGLSYLCSYLIGIFWKEEPFIKPPLENTLNKTIFLKFCSITMLTLIVHWMLTVSDQLIIKYYYGYAALAPYAVAYRIVTIISLLSGIFLSYYPGVYFEEIATKNILEVFLLRKYFIFILVLATIGILYFKNSVYLVLGAASYTNESVYFFPLLLGEMCRTLASVLMTFLTFKLQQTAILLSMFFIAVLNIVLNVLFVPYFGPLAAAYCTLMCFILYLGVSFFISYIPERHYIMLEFGQET